MTYYLYDSNEEINDFVDCWDNPKYRHGFLYSERIPDNKCRNSLKSRIKFHEEEMKMARKGRETVNAELHDADNKKMIIPEEVAPGSVEGSYLQILLLLNMYRTKDEVVVEDLYSQYVFRDELEERLERMEYWHSTVLALFRAKDDLAVYDILSKCGRKIRPMLDYMLAYLRRAESISDNRLFYSDPLIWEGYAGDDVSIYRFRDAYQRAIRVGLNMIEATAISQRNSMSELRGEVLEITKTKDSVLSSLKRDQPRLFPTE